MRPPRLAVGLAMLAAFWLHAFPPVGAQVVTVDLKDATIQDVAKALEDQTGMELQFVGQRKPAAEEVRIPAFMMDKQPLKEVLRAACEQTGYRYRRVQAELFWIEQGKFEESPYRTRAGGYLLAVERLNRRGASNSLDFSRGAAQPGTFPEGLDVALSIEAPTDEAAQMIHGFKDVRVTDDSGRISHTPPELAQWAQLQMRRLQFFPTPDRAEVQLMFEPAGQGVTAIKALEGTLVLYQQAQTLEFRFDDLGAQNVTLREGGLEVTLQGVRMSAGGCTVNLTNRVLGAVPEPEPEEWGRATLILIAEDGRQSKTDSTFFPSNSTAYGVNFPEGFEPASLILQVVRRRYPTRELPFTIENIPLPK